MKSLQEFIAEHVENGIFENTFSSSNWSHNGAYDYAIEVIDKLINGDDLKTGKNGEGEVIKSDLFNVDALAELKKSITQKTYKDLNACLKDPNSIKYNIWTNLYKGDFSGYVPGNSKNRGNAFESDFINNFALVHKEELENALGYKLDVNGELKAEGILNKKRPLALDADGNLYVTPKNLNEVGSYVTDVTVPLVGNKNLFLSLKFGKLVTFINCGINNKEGFPKEAFIDADKNKIGKIGNAIIDLFGIDTKKFINAFNEKNYIGGSKKSPYETHDVTKLINIERLLNFIYSVIGCGFVLVHKINNDVHYYKLLDTDMLKKFVGNIEKVVTKYPINGNKKRVDIYVETSGLEIEFTIRAKNGGFYPTHIMSDYKIK